MSPRETTDPVRAAKPDPKRHVVRRTWKAPTFERQALKDALSGGEFQTDGVASFS